MTKLQTIVEADPHSFANPNQIRVTALHLDLDVSFARRQLSGCVTLSLGWMDPDASTLVVDTHALDITAVQTSFADGAWTSAAYRLGAHDPVLGQALHIDVPAACDKVRIAYASNVDAAGLQWLEPAQTAGGKHPFMYSQSQAINARSWVPLQDSPSVRFTYTANVRVPVELRALMSADNDPQHALDGVFHFSMPQKIPSYLLAIAVGDLAAREIGPRTAVFAEPPTLAAAAWEFEDTPRMIAITEDLYGPYRWDRYDILVLPPSFPFGGMENPRLTFVTPTVIAGDKSLVSVIAHELAHSWSGNLVSNASWRQIWLNEGFTTFVQGRIVEAVYGKAQADDEFIIDAHELRVAMKKMPAQDQRLLTDLEGRDPDEALSKIPYIKGSWFLQWLQARFGRARFDAFVRGYFDHFAFESITTAQFEAYLHTHLLERFPGVVGSAEIAHWIHDAGIPNDAPLPQSPRLSANDAARDGLLSGKIPAAKLNAEHWSAQQWMYFLDRLPTSMTAELLADLDAEYRLSGTHNAEVAFRWYRLAIASDYHAAFPAMRKHMLRIGRRILVVPLYAALAKSDQGKVLATEIYAQARDGYHPMTRASVDKALRNEA